MQRDQLAVIRRDLCWAAAAQRIAHNLARAQLCQIEHIIWVGRDPVPPIPLLLPVAQAIQDRRGPDARIGYPIAIDLHPSDPCSVPELCLSNAHSPSGL